MKLFKPMLAATCKDIGKLTFPVLASVKLDGVRATVQGGKLYSRTLKLIPNKHVQEMFEELPNGLDGELIAGDPAAPDCYRKTVSIVMSEGKDALDISFHVFDFKKASTFFDRITTVQQMCANYKNIGVPVIPLEHRTMRNVTQLEIFESGTVQAGHEGVMLRSIEGPYKEGRSTEREGYLLKLKRFADSEAEVIGVTELMHNGNEAKTNALGRTERSSHKAGMVGTGMLGALCVRDVKTGVGFEIGTGFTDEERKQIWAVATAAEGVHVWKLAKYKYFALGSKDKPRFPVFLGWRDKRDI